MKLIERCVGWEITPVSGVCETSLHHGVLAEHVNRAASKGGLRQVKRARNAKTTSVKRVRLAAESESDED